MAIQDELKQVLDPIIVPGADRTGVIEKVTEIARAEFFKGPIAHPSHLAEYERICPGLADRITKMAEFRQQKSEARLDKAIDLEYADRRRGMFLGFASLIALLTAGCVVSIFGNMWIGGILLGAATLGAVIAPFVDGRGARSLSVSNFAKGRQSKSTQADTDTSSKPKK